MRPHSRTCVSSIFSFLSFVGKGKKVVSKRESAKEAEEAQTKAAAQKAKLAQVL